VAALASRLGVPVVPVQANRRLGLEALRGALDEVAERPPSLRPPVFPAAFQQEVDDLAVAFAIAADGDGKEDNRTGVPPRYLLERLILDRGGFLESSLLAKQPQSIARAVAAARDHLTNAACPVPALETTARYRWVNDTIDGLIRTTPTSAENRSDRLDALLTHPLWGLFVLALVLLVMFQAVFSWATWPMEQIEAGVGLVGSWVERAMPGGGLRSLLVDGVIGGVGAVIVFLPQILILFFFLALLEDCGYLARAAYLMDRTMVRFGLSGKSFIPLLSSFACAIPGVMAARVIDDRRDRLTTILVAPLMSCSARLPVYALLTAAFVPSRPVLGPWLDLQALTFLAMYALGIVTAAAVALLLKKTLLRGGSASFVMELPPYRRPSWRVVFFRMFERAWVFVRGAGTLILSVSILMWAALYYPRLPADRTAVLLEDRAALDRAASQADLRGDAESRDRLHEQIADIDAHLAGEQSRYSVLGRFGRSLEPLVRPLGWDWRIGSAAIASFPAREVVVASLGVIFDVGKEAGAGREGGRLRDALKSATWPDSGKPLFTLPVALSLMVFFALCAQCVSTLAVMARETNSWRWPAFCFGYMTALAYLGALITYQVGSRLV
jgi:ferrous iron transport protein B